MRPIIGRFWVMLEYNSTTCNIANWCTIVNVQNRCMQKAQRSGSSQPDRSTRKGREGTQQGQQAGRQSGSEVSVMLIIVMVAAWTEPFGLFGDDATQRNATNK